MFLDTINEVLLPFVIALAETMGIFVVVWSLIKSFWEYIMDTFFHKDYNLKIDLPTGLATSLSFMMAAEILKTIGVHDYNDLIALGAIIIMRVALTVLIHFEMTSEEKREGSLKKEDHGQVSE